MHMGM